MCSWRRPTHRTSHAVMLAAVFGLNEGYAINDDAWRGMNASMMSRRHAKKISRRQQRKKWGFPFICYKTRFQMRWSVECEECSVKCGAWRVQCEVWSVECEESNEKWEVWSVDCEVWSVECEVWIGESAVWSEKCEVLIAKGAVWSVKTVKCEVRRGASNVTCATRHQFRRVHARTGLAGARRMQVL